MSFSKRILLISSLVCLYGFLVIGLRSVFIPDVKEVLAQTPRFSPGGAATSSYQNVTSDVLISGSLSVKSSGGAPAVSPSPGITIGSTDWYRLSGATGLMGPGANPATIKPNSGSNVYWDLGAVNGLKLTNTAGTTTYGYLMSPDGGTTFGLYDKNANPRAVTDGVSLSLNPSGGNVGIGTTGPVEKLQVAGSITTTSNAVSNIASAGKLDFSGGSTRIISYGSGTSTYGNFQVYLSTSNNSGTSGVKLHIDGSTGNVGIGTTIPNSLFVVDGSSFANYKAVTSVNNCCITLDETSTSVSSYPYIQWLKGGVRGMYMGWGQAGNYIDMRLENNNKLAITGGDLGIGTIPSARLNVSGGWPQIRLDAPGANDSIGFNLYTNNVYKGWMIYNNSAVGALEIQNYNNGPGGPLLLNPQYGGNVGIGTTTPGYKLDVNGDVKGNRLCILADCRNAWPAGGSGTFTEADTLHDVTTRNPVTTNYITVSGVTTTKGALYYSGGEGGTLTLEGANGVKNHIESLNGKLRGINSPWTEEIWSIDQSGKANFDSGVEADYLYSARNATWLPYPDANNINYIRGNTRAFNQTWYDENRTNYFLDPDKESAFARLTLTTANYGASVAVPDATSWQLRMKDDAASSWSGIGVGARYHCVGSCDPWDGLMMFYMAPRWHAFYTSNDSSNVRFQINDNGNVYLNADVNPTNGNPNEPGEYAHSAFDMAENISTNADEPIEAGDLIVPSINLKEYGTRSTKEYQQSLIGIISTAPGVLGGAVIPGNTPVVTNGKPLSIAGRVPTKVSTLNGKIKIGDQITSSALVGVGMKATKAGPTVGKAMEEFDPANGKGQTIECPAGSPAGIVCGKIVALLNVSNFDPDTYLTSTDGYTLTSLLNGSYQLKDKENNVVNRIGAFGKIIASSIKVGLIDVDRLVVKGVDILDTLQKQQAEIDQLKAEIELLKAKQ